MRPTESFASTVDSPPLVDSATARFFRNLLKRSLRAGAAVLAAPCPSRQSAYKASAGPVGFTSCRLHVNNRAPSHGERIDQSGTQLARRRVEPLLARFWVAFLVRVFRRDFRKSRKVQSLDDKRVVTFRESRGEHSVLVASPQDSPLARWSIVVLDLKVDSLV